ncbi:MAG TPA: YciI family protein [Gemmatimonadaceae bacterium]|nr:YciI family protein [Gemmatimonadaceae bacterium]
MRVMIIRKADAQTEAGMMPSERMLAAMGAYMKRMSDAGILLAGEGLKPSSASARVAFTNGKPRVFDGPFAEAKELIAGYALIRVSSLDEAVEWAKQWPTIETETNVELELRPLFEEDDFGDEFTPELRKQEADMRAKAAASQ